MPSLKPSHMYVSPRAQVPCYGSHRTWQAGPTEQGGGSAASGAPRREGGGAPAAWEAFLLEARSAPPRPRPPCGCKTSHTEARRQPDKLALESSADTLSRNTTLRGRAGGQAERHAPQRPRDTRRGREGQAQRTGDGGKRGAWVTNGDSALLVSADKNQ